MKRLLLPLFALAACGDDLVPTPVDMAYDVRVIELDHDCGGTPLPDDQRASLDLQLRVDGSVRLNGWVPSLLVQPSFIHLFPHDGRIDVETKDQYGDIYRVSGPLTMEAIDLTLDFPGYRPDGSGQACRQRLRLQGAARGFRDPASLDGLYPLHTDYYGVVCGSDPLPSVPVGSGTLRIDGRPRDGTLYLDLEDAFWFYGAVPDASGQVDWSGTFYLLDDSGIIDAPGTFKGTFGPGGVQADLAFTDGRLAAGCSYRYAFAGAKQVAALENRAGAYRGVLRTYDTCEDPPMPVAFEQQVDLVERDGGRVAIYDVGGAFVVGLDGETLSASAGSRDLGEVLTFTGISSPPYLSYTFDDTYQVGSTWCSIGWDVDAVLRYFPEIEWEPAFQPDPPMTTLPSARRLPSDRKLGPLPIR